jgi:DNA-binding XRE family transcriptional regulator
VDEEKPLCSCTVCYRSDLPIGLQIRRARKALNWTQQELADKAGVNASTVNTIESLNKNGSIPKLTQIAEALGIAITIGQEGKWMFENYKHCWKESLVVLKTVSKHGTNNAYAAGCRCVRCKRYKKMAMRKYRKRRKERGDPVRRKAPPHNRSNTDDVREKSRTSNSYSRRRAQDDLLP